MAMRSFFRKLGADRRGVTAIETALILPPMLMLSLGSFDVSRMIARQNELQKAANEASDIALAANPDNDSRRATVKSIIMASTGLTTDKVTVSAVYRCGTNVDFVTSPTSCTTGSVYSTYVRVVITDTYTPMWTTFGLGGPVSYSITRQVQTS
jgi:Flp pilus assembly protein TadG